MILDHVANSATLIIDVTPSGNAEGLSHCDLHVIDVITIPYRFKKGVRKAKEVQILDRLFAKKMIDSKYRRFREGRVQRRVQFSSRFQIAAKRLFDNDAGALGVAGFRSEEH